MTVRLIIGEAAHEVRRVLGASAWTALEVVVARVGDVDGQPVAPVSVREVADELGVAKNTAHRAIRRLIEAGLVAPIQDRSPAGRFLGGAYRVDVPTDVLCPASRRPVASPRRHAPRRDRTATPTQLSLLAT